MSRRRLLGGAALGLGAIAVGPALASCSSSGSGGDSAGGTTTLKFLTNDAQTDLLKQVFAKYEKANPGVKVNATFAPSAQYGALANTQLQSGNGPDALEAAAGSSGAGGMAIQALAAQGVLADLSDQPWASKTPDSLRPITDFNGKTYGLFTTAGAIPTFYNMSVLQSVDAAPPTTWTELLAVCEKLKAKGTPAFSQGLKDGWPSILIPYALTSTLVYGVTPDWEQQHMDGTVTFAGSGWEHAMELYDELNQKGYFSPASTSNGFTEMNTDVGAGKAAMCVPVSQGLPVIETVAKPEGIGSFALPANDDAASTHVPFGLAFGVCLYSKSKEPDATKKLIQFLSEPEQVATLAGGGGNLPVLVDDGTQLESPLQPMLPFISAAKTSPYPDPLWPSQKVQDAQIKQTQLMLSGNASPKDVVTAMDQAYAEGA